MGQREDWRLTDKLHYDHGRGDPFAAAVRATRMPMLITDPSRPDNPIVFANEAFQDLTGYSREEVIGRNCRFLQGPETDPAVVARLRDAIHEGRDVAVDLLNYRKDGSTFWNALYMSPVRSDDGGIRFFFASQLDVTDRVVAQKRIAEQKAEIERQVATRTNDLAQALDAKTLLLHELDHRVKNNLGMIASLLRLQIREARNENVTEALGSVLARVDALAAVHRRLFEFDGSLKFDAGVFLKTFAQDLVAASGQQKIDLDTEIERTVIASDKASAVGLVLSVVLSNAIRHAAQSGEPSLKLSASLDDGVASIGVADGGGSGAGASELEQLLVERLAQQIGGRLEWRPDTPGSPLKLVFPAEG